MRILIISTYFPPENSSASLRPYAWAKYWSKVGNEVCVLTTVKDSSRPEAMHVEMSGFQVKEINYNSLFNSFKSILMSRVGSNEQQNRGIPKNNILKNNSQASVKLRKNFITKINEWRKTRGLSITARMPDQTDLWIRPATKWAISNGPWDLVISTYGPYSCHLVGLKLKRAKICKNWIADFRDLWTDNPIFKGLYPLTFIEKYLEKEIVENADYITTVSEPLAETLQNKYRLAKVQVIENGFDSNEVFDSTEERIFNDDKVRIIHTGTVYKGRMNPVLLFETIASIANDNTLAPLLNNLEVVFLGSDNSNSISQAETMKITDWVKDGGFLPRKDVIRMQREAHALLFLGFDKGKTPGILSGKLYEYIFSETPIWAIDVDSTSGVGEIILNANAGILFGQDGNFLKSMLVQLLKNPIKSKTSLNRSYLQQFERSNLAYKMLNLVNYKNIR